MKEGSFERPNELDLRTGKNQETKEVAGGAMNGDKNFTLAY